MNNTYITYGEIIDEYTVHLNEPVKISSKKARIIIEPIEEEKKYEIKFGCAKGQITMSDDFNEPLEDFKEYME